MKNINSTYFYYAGEYSQDKGIYLIRTENELIKDPFLGDRKIISELIPGNDIPYYYGYTTKPLEFNLKFSPLSGLWTFEKRSEIARWFNTNKFEEFYSADNINKKYYLMYTGGIDLYTTGVDQGYIECSFVNISPYSYSSYYIEIFDFSTIVAPTTFTINNLGDNNLYPEIEIVKVTNGNITIVNNTNGGKGFELSNLLNNEIVYIDNKRKQIINDIADTPRYDDFNGDYLELVRGINTLEITGTCTLNIRYQYEFIG